MTMFGSSRATLRAQVVALREALAAADTRETYWREKCEILLDQTLFHRGEIRQHVFSKPPEPSKEQNAMGRVFGALAHTEIESAKRPATVLVSG